MDEPVKVLTPEEEAKAKAEMEELLAKKRSRDAARQAGDGWLVQDVRPGRTGGVYIPPFKLAQMRKEAGEDKASEQFQRLSWDALRKSINGLINKVNTSNLVNIIPELFRENLVRGRGLFARAVMKAQVRRERGVCLFVCAWAFVIVCECVCLRYAFVCETVCVVVCACVCAVVLNELRAR